MSHHPVRTSTPAAASVGRSLLYLIVAGVAWGTAGAAASLLFRASDFGSLALSFWRCVGGGVHPQGGHPPGGRPPARGRPPRPPPRAPPRRGGRPPGGPRG
ncbi:hypothetical protein ACFV08_17800, partial [Streptomyces fradiae]